MMRESGPRRRMPAASRRPSSRIGRGWHVGVDLGGTWVRVAATDASGRCRQFKAPAPALADLPAVLTRLWRRWRLDRSRVDGLAVASRGVWTTAERGRLARGIRAFASRVRVLSDAEAAYLGALGDAPGVLLLAGTGSMALGRDGRGRWIRAGGLGPLLGDEGSAFWIGREWLRGSARPADFARLRRILGSPQPVARIAALATVVVRRARAGSPRARAIVSEAQDALADLLLAAAKRVGVPPPIPTSWTGALLDDERYRAGIWRAARRRGGALRAVPPADTAVNAALRLAAAGRPSRGSAPGRPDPGAMPRPAGGRDSRGSARRRTRPGRSA